MEAASYNSISGVSSSPVTLLLQEAGVLLACSDWIRHPDLVIDYLVSKKLCEHVKCYCIKMEWSWKYRYLIIYVVE